MYGQLASCASMRDGNFFFSVGPFPSVCFFCCILQVILCRSAGLQFFPFSFLSVAGGLTMSSAEVVSLFPYNSGAPEAVRTRMAHWMFESLTPPHRTTCLSVWHPPGHHRGHRTGRGDPQARAPLPESLHLLLACVSASLAASWLLTQRPASGRWGARPPRWTRKWREGWCGGSVFVVRYLPALGLRSAEVVPRFHCPYAHRLALCWTGAAESP